MCKNSHQQFWLNDDGAPDLEGLNVPVRIAIGVASALEAAHRRGACVIAVYTRDVAETKAKEATELGKSKGYLLFFTTEPEE